MADFLDTLARDAKKTIDEGYYTTPLKRRHEPLSLRKSIITCNRAPVIAEIKLASPTLGVLREDTDVKSIATMMQGGGAIALSVLTEPKHFKGSLSTFIKVRKRVELPLLMKDVFLDRDQIDVASAIGADAVLLIKALFNRGYCECDVSDMIKYAHSKGIEAVLETHTEEEFSLALETEADVVGINNRDLATLKVDIDTTRRILQKLDFKERVVVSESGIKTSSDIQYLRAYGATAFLVGSAIMMAGDPKKKVEELVLAL